MWDRSRSTQSVKDRKPATREVHLIGDLDLSNRASVTRTCVAGIERTVIVNLSRLVFMDCAGFGALVAARAELDQQGRTMTLVGASGEPARLLKLIAENLDA